MSMDNLLQQLEKRSAERMSPQGPSDLSQHQDDDQSCKQSVGLKDSPNMLNKYNSEQFLRAIESVGNINSYEFLKNEKAQPLNFVKDDVDVNRIKANGSVDVQKIHNSDDKCDVTNFVQTVNQNQEQNNHSESNLNSFQNMSGAEPVHHISKLQKQNAVDFENLSTNEFSDCLPDLTTSSLRHDSDLSGQESDTPVYEQKLTSDSENADTTNEGHEDEQNEDQTEPIECDGSEDTNNSEIVSDASRQDSLEEEVRQLTVPTEIPAVTGWKLDRRESGHLFWRRDSSTLNGVDPSSRVKFRYDVEVCEFESRGSETEDLLEEDEEEQEDGVTLDSQKEMQKKSCKDSSLSDASTLTVEQSSSTYLTAIYIFAAFGIVISLLYGWFTYLFYDQRVEETENS